MKPRYIMANWKMYVGPREALKLARLNARLAKNMPAKTDLVVFPTALSFTEVANVIGKKAKLGAQNTHWVGKGGATGEVSAEMYKEAGAKYVLVGHSERRHLFHETNHDVRQKIEGALAAGMIPVVCVGETKIDQKSGISEEVIETQIRAAYTDIAWPKKTPLIIAYEPVWAISHGTGKHEQGEYCAPEQAELMHELILHFVEGLVPNTEPVVLYGGSVRAGTVRSYLAMPHISGVIVGAASTKATDWTSIVENATK